MANIKSTKKRILQDAKKALRNKMVKSQTQTAIKKYEKLVSSDKEEALTLLKSAVVLIDKAANKGIFHRNKSSRIKARLHKHFVRTYPETTQNTVKNQSTVKKPVEQEPANNQISQ